MGFSGFIIIDTIALMIFGPKPSDSGDLKLSNLDTYVIISCNHTHSKTCYSTEPHDSIS